MEKKKIAIGIIAVALLISIPLFTLTGKKKEEDKKTQNVSGTILEMSKSSLTIQDENNGIYTFNMENVNASIGDNIVLEYLGVLEKERNKQSATITNYTVSKNSSLIELPVEWSDEGIFKDYYEKAFKKLNTLTLEEKIGQLFLGRYEDTAVNDLKTYPLGGFVFFEKDFKNKTTPDVKTMINTLQSNSKIPLLTAVDEEGGKVNRISTNPNLVAEPFKSSKELYKNGGFTKIKEDTIEKSKILANLGLNLNLAPVVDITTSQTDYMYERSLGENAEITSNYAKTVIEASKGTSVSYTLKHFPGYGNNRDTHTSTSVDDRTYESLINNDFLPFDAGIKSGAEAVLVSHNIVTNIDDVNPASLSPSIHNVLRNRLDFTGIIITDDLAMGATSSIENATTKALLAGNDLIITTDYQKGIEEIKSAINKGTVSDELVNRVALRVLAWKYYKGLLFDNEK